MRFHLARVTGADVGMLKLLKFIHKQINADDLRESAAFRGADLSSHTAHLIFHEQGLSPLILRPRHDPLQGWGWTESLNENNANETTSLFK